MNFRAVLICLCLLTAHVARRSARNLRPPSNTLELMKKDVRSVLDSLGAPGMLPAVPSLSLNCSVLVGPERRRPTPHHLSTFRCHLMKVSEFTVANLSPKLQMIGQQTEDAEQDWRGHTVSQNCGLPLLETKLESSQYAKLLLECMEEWLGKAIH